MSSNKKSSQNQKKVGKKRTRATNVELCERYKKERSHIYYERRKVKKALEKTGLTDKKLEVLFRREDRLNAKLGKINSKIFKCGKKYAKLKKTRRNIGNRISKIRHDLKFNTSLGKSERDKLLKEMLKLNEVYRGLSEAMGMDIVEQSRGEIDFVRDIETGVSSFNTPIWLLRTEVINMLEGGRFSTVLVAGEEFDTKKNSVDILFALDELEIETTSSQKSSKVKTPMVRITTDLKNRTIIIS